MLKRNKLASNLLEIAIRYKEINTILVWIPAPHAIFNIWIIYVTGYAVDPTYRSL